MHISYIMVVSPHRSTDGELDILMTFVLKVIRLYFSVTNYGLIWHTSS